MSSYVPGKKGICFQCGIAPAIKGKRCPACSIEHAAEVGRQRNAALKAKRDAESPNHCVDCGALIRGNAKRCPEHSRVHNLTLKKANEKRKRELAKQEKAAGIKHPEAEHIRPHRAVKVAKVPTMTDAEREALDAKQRLLDLQLRARDDQDTADRLGLEYQPGKPLASTVRRLSRAEIAAIAGTLTPPQRVRELVHYIY